MSNVKLKTSGLAFPKKEKAFILTADKNAPFKAAIIGTTYPDSAYRIERKPICDLTVFEYVAEGEGEIFIDGEWRTARAGDSYVLAPNEHHLYRTSEKRPWKKYWINYVSDYMGEYLRAYGLGTGIYRVNSLPIFEKLGALCKKKELTDDDLFSVSKYVHEIVSLAARRDGSRGTAEKIKSMILSAIYGKLSIDSVAEEVHLSKSSVIRIFKKEFGVSPYEFLINSKMEVAKTLLRTTSLSVRQISEKLEIIDEHYFSTLFYKKVGLRPLEYRRSI